MNAVLLSLCSIERVIVVTRLRDYAQQTQFKIQDLFFGLLFADVKHLFICVNEICVTLELHFVRWRLFCLLPSMRKTKRNQPE